MTTPDPLDKKTWHTFQDQFLSQTDEFGLSQHCIDHIAYRVPSLARYAEVLNDLGKDRGNTLQEVEFGGRPIAIVRLTKPLYAHGATFSLIELMAPKPGISCEEGWDHGEFVVPIPLVDFMAKHPSVEFNRHGLNKKLNPTVSVALDYGLTAKFHRIPLDEIMRLESALGLTPGT